MVIRHSKLRIQLEALIEEKMLQRSQLRLDALHALLRLVAQIHLAELLQPRELLGNQHAHRALRETLWSAHDGCERASTTGDTYLERLCIVGLAAGFEIA